MANGRFVSYLRVSTAQQGASGLGLEAQRTAVQTHLNGGRWELLQEVQEIESGKRNDRPALAQALRLCKQKKATLVIAKLDRLARNVHFISGLMESGVEFVACDMPAANKFVLHIMAAVAEQEAEAISARTKAALAASTKKLGGRRVSSKRFAEIREQGRAARAYTADAFASQLMVNIRDIRAKGAESLREIAAELNSRGLETPRGGEWSAVQVQRVIARTLPAETACVSSTLGAEVLRHRTESIDGEA
jgi:DNA invertase Pin-like site-specific DNA recombinase